MSNSKNDIAWQKLFDKYKVIEKINNQGHVLIGSSKINEFREARLMTKFDHRSQLPSLFIENNLSILPVSRGDYVIGTFEAFQVFNNDKIETIRIDVPNFLESLDFKNITSEATAINGAFISKILHHFIQEETLFPTVNGRMSSLNFSFKINDAKGNFDVTVRNSQIEIDGGFEGDSSLSIIEAKNYISDDFLIRQLYYPFKLWSNKIRKPIKSIFLTYTNGIFHLREYVFNDINHYNSIQLVKQCKYAAKDGVINIEVIQNILENTTTISEPSIPFPQADSFERVINLCELLVQKGFLTKEHITNNYDFDSRQTDYYANAAKYLGFIYSCTENNVKGYALTNRGKQVFNLSIIDRQLEFAKAILSHLVFKNSLLLSFKKGNIPIKAEIVEIMENSKLYRVEKKSTFIRRSSTIICWLNWILKLVEE